MPDTTPSPFSVAQQPLAKKLGFHTKKSLNKGCQAPLCKFETPIAIKNHAAPPPAPGGRKFVLGDPKLRPVIVDLDTLPSETDTEEYVTGYVGFLDNPKAFYATTPEGGAYTIFHFGCAARYRGLARRDEVSEWVKKRWRKKGAKKAHSELMNNYWNDVRRKTTTGSTAERKQLKASASASVSR